MKKKICIISCFVIISICWILIFALKYIINKTSANAQNPESIETIFVNDINFASVPGIEILDANNTYFRVYKNDLNLINADIKITSNIKVKKTINRMQMIQEPLKQIMLKLNNKEYPAVIDTGFFGYFTVNDVVIVENKLKIFPFEKSEPHVAGYSWIDEVQLGDMNITNIFSYYKLGHYEKRVPGKDAEKLGQVILGLKFLRQHKYVLLDNVASEIEFSLESFQADPNEQWKQYKMSFEKDKANNLRAVVEIPIAGESTKIMFDTGAAFHLSMSKSKWENFSEKLNVINERNIRLAMAHGFIESKEKTIGELNIGERIFFNTPIYVSNEETILGSEEFVLGMGCFEDTTIVLDFKNNLFWVRGTSQ